MWTIIKKEWLEIGRDRVSTVLLVSFTLLMLVSLVISWNYNKWYTEMQRQVTANAREHWEMQGVKNSHSAAHFGIYLFKPLSSLALWDTGIDKHVGVSIFVEAHKRNSLQLKAIEDNPLLARWGELTPAYVLIFLLPLLIVWLTSNSIIKERADGTLKMVLSQGVSLTRYVWAKAFSIWIICAALISFFWIVGGILVSQISNEGFFTSQSLWLMIVYILFAGVFIHLGLFISLRSQTQRNALVLLVGVWLVMIWFVPRFTTQLSERLYPSPTSEAFLKQISDDIAVNGINGHGGENEKMKKLKAAWTKNYNVDSVQQLPLNWLGVTLQADEDTNNVIYERHYAQLYELYERQHRIQKLSSILSPVIPARTASMALSGTDLAASAHFSESVDAYRKDFIRILNNRLRDKSRYNERDTGTVEFWKTLPVFKYSVPPAEEKWSRAKSSLLVLSVWLLVSVALMHISIKSVKII
jgi:ABC-2 type transport system permease protein